MAHDPKVDEEFAERVEQLDRMIEMVRAFGAMLIPYEKSGNPFLQESANELIGRAKKAENALIDASSEAQAFFGNFRRAFMVEPK